MRGTQVKDEKMKHDKMMRSGNANHNQQRVHELVYHVNMRRWFGRIGE